MMKRRCISLLAALFLLISTAACSVSPGARTVDADTAQELTVYLTQGDFAWQEIVRNFEAHTADIKIHVETFETAQELEQRQAEEIAEGGGPDLVLFNALTAESLDLRHMARAGVLLPLDSYFSTDRDFDPENYYTPVLENGIFDGERFAVTVGFTLPGFITSEEKMSGAGITAGGDLPMGELFAVIAGEAERLADDPEHYAYLQYLDSVGFSTYLSCSGLLTLDDLGNLFTVERMEKMEDLFTLYRTMFRERQRASGTMRTHPEALEQGTFLDTGMDPAMFLLYAAVIFQRDMGCMPHVFMVPSYDDANQYVARTLLEAAVNCNSKSPELAYRFIRYAMDGPMPHILQSSVDSVNPSTYSPNRRVLESYLEAVPGLGAYRTPGIQAYEAVKPAVQHALSQLSGCFTMYPELYDIASESILPFLAGDTAFEDCYADLTGRLEAYLAV